VGRDALLAVARNMVLQTLDMLWVEHLESMEYLRGSVNLRAYGQRDPLVEYRKEGTHLYKEMEVMLASRVFELIEGLTKEGTAGATSLAVVPTTVPRSIEGLHIPAVQGEIGRNDPCPCGSGKKYKNCGLKNTEEHQRLMAEK
jgi:preprotein translocase subunit SecA